ncbi:MAG: hypothetical protein K2K12_04330, partial [Clostridia bacterium]|nr:hypothetical protein [Clostridia bacterium]
MIVKYFHTQFRPLQSLHLHCPKLYDIIFRMETEQEKNEIPEENAEQIEAQPSSEMQTQTEQTPPKKEKSPKLK